MPRFRNCENVISIAAMEEISCRQSRLCGLLGNPIPVKTEMEVVFLESRPVFMSGRHVEVSHAPET